MNYILLYYIIGAALMLAFGFAAGIFGTLAYQSMKEARVAKAFVPKSYKNKHGALTHVMISGQWQKLPDSMPDRTTVFAYKSIAPEFIGQLIKTTGRQFKVFARDGFKCKGCGEKAVVALLTNRPGMNKTWKLYTKDFMPFTLDHVKTKAQGGKNSLNNMQTMCSKCNTEKGADVHPMLDKLMDEFGGKFGPRAKSIADKQLANNVAAYKDELRLLVKTFVEQRPGAVKYHAQILEWAWMRYTRRRLRDLKKISHTQL